MLNCTQFQLLYKDFGIFFLKIIFLNCLLFQLNLFFLNHKNFSVTLIKYLLLAILDFPALVLSNLHT